MKFRTTKSTIMFTDQEKNLQEKNPEGMNSSFFNKIHNFSVFKGILCFLILLTILIIVFIYLRPTIPPGPDKYYRDVYILIDQTPSLRSDQIEKSKYKIREEIIEECGLGDRIYCYQIGSKFDGIRDLIFESDRSLPMVPDNITEYELDNFSGARSLERRLRNDWKFFEQERKKWIHSVDSSSYSGGNKSDYRGALNEIGSRLSNKNDTIQAKDRWLIVFGDLKHDTKTSISTFSVETTENLFASTHICLIYPAGVYKNEEEQALIKKQWKAYFEARGNENVKFYSLSGFTRIIPQNNIPNPRKIDSAEKSGNSKNN